MTTLDDLFPNMGFAQFLLRYFPSYPVVAHASSAAVNHTAEDLLARLPADETVIAYVQQDGTTRQQRVDAPRGRELFERGHALSLERAQLLLPEIGELNLLLHRACGIEWATNVSLILSPAGSVVPLHFDGVELLIHHLVGRKRWSIGPSNHPQADFTWFPGEHGSGPRGGRLPGWVLHEDAPTPPEQLEAHELSAGGTLFIPRGWWHETCSLTTTVNVVFRLRTLNAAQVVGEAITAALSHDPRWRLPIPGLVGAPALRPLARARLAPLLAELGDEAWASAINLARSLAPFTGPQLRLTQLLQIETDDEGPRLCLPARGEALPLSPETRPVATWLEQHVQDFTPLDLQLEGCSRVAVIEVLSWLWDLGVLEAA